MVSPIAVLSIFVFAVSAIDVAVAKPPPPPRGNTCAKYAECIMKQGGQCLEQFPNIPSKCSASQKQQIREVLAKLVSLYKQKSIRVAECAVGNNTDTSTTTVALTTTTTSIEPQTTTTTLLPETTTLLPETTTLLPETTTLEPETTTTTLAPETTTEHQTEAPTTTVHIETTSEHVETTTIHEGSTTEHVTESTSSHPVTLQRRRRDANDQGFSGCKVPEKLPQPTFCPRDSSKGSHDHSKSKGSHEHSKSKGSNSDEKSIGQLKCIRYICGCPQLAFCETCYQLSPLHTEIETVRQQLLGLIAGCAK